MKLKPEIQDSMKLILNSLSVVVCGVILSLPLTGQADTSFTINNTVADAFLATGSPGNPIGSDLTSLNFGGAGTLAISPASATKGRFDSIIKFNTGAAVSQFNATYGAGNWTLTSLTLSLASNFGDQGEQPNNGVFNPINAGSFGIDWLGYDGWVEGNGSGMGTPGYPSTSFVSFNSITTLYSSGSASLGTYHYTPPGDNLYLNYSLSLAGNLVSDATAGGDLSLYFYAADNQVGYLFNSRTFAANRPQLTLNATLVPEPGVFTLLAATLGGFLISRRRKK